MPQLRLRRSLLPLLVVLAPMQAGAASAAGPATEPPAELVGQVEDAVARQDLEALRATGPRALPLLAQLYERGDRDRRLALAHLFYGLGWRSPRAARVLLADVHTEDQELRLAVQYALGRVSDDPSIVQTLLANMREDPNRLFRDKAACALAYDQIHLDEREKVALFAGLIAALDDPKSDVRRIALQALLIHTGQNKGFRVNGPLEGRRASIAAWRQWLAEYKANL